jgi:hypothetical protein
MLALTQGVQAQRIHDEGRDKQAQEAAKLAEEITSRSTFDSQLKNLDTLSKRDLEVYFRGAKRQMELEISGFRTWGDVNDFVQLVRTTLKTEDFIARDQATTINGDLEKDCPDRTSPLGISICTAQSELARLKKAVKDSEDQGKALDQELKTRLEKIDQIESLVTKAQTFLKSGSTANQTIKGLSEVFLNLSKSYVNYTNKLEKIKNQPKDELKLVLQRIAVETLQLEADHWNTVGEIQLRRGEEQKNLQRLVEDFEFRLEQLPKCLPIDAVALKGERVSKTFARAKKEFDKWQKAAAASESAGRVLPEAETGCKITNPENTKTETILPYEELVTYLYEALFSASALAARGNTPMKLAQLRLAQEEHRYSIRQSAIVARGYELAISSGTKRLARYYAGGLRPEKIAQLIYAAATVAIPGVIAGK